MEAHFSQDLEYLISLLRVGVFEKVVSFCQRELLIDGLFLPYRDQAKQSRISSKHHFMFKPRLLRRTLTPGASAGDDHSPKE